MNCPPHLRTLNQAQRAAVEFGIAEFAGVQAPGPLFHTIKRPFAFDNTSRRPDRWCEKGARLEQLD
jgi:hypothetical protein